MSDHPIVGTPTKDTHAANKKYVDDALAGGAKWVNIPITATPGNFDSTAVLSADAIVYKVIVTVGITPYDGTPTIIVGFPSSPDSILALTDEADLLTPGTYSKDQLSGAPGAEAIRATFARGGGTAVGSAVVSVLYSDPPGA